jgi:hypothetical protein
LTTFIDHRRKTGIAPGSFPRAGGHGLRQNPAAGPGERSITSQITEKVLDDA